jgi:plastocyanin
VTGPPSTEEDVVRKALIPAAAVTALFVAAPLAAPAAVSRKATIRESEFKLAPKKAVVRHGRVTFTLRNTGKFPHALEIEKGGKGGKDLKSRVVAPGKTAKFTVTLKKGKFEMYCPVDHHKQMGMTGSLTVR